jgi:hypothetical protein
MADGENNKRDGQNEEDGRRDDAEEELGRQPFY